MFYMIEVLNYRLTSSGMDNIFGLGVLGGILGSIHRVPTGITHDNSQSIGVKNLHALLLTGSRSVTVTGAVPVNLGREILLSPELFDDRFHYDFTNIDDKGKKFHRGGEIYTRPCGWKRFALKVKGKYSDDIWLVGNGKRPDQYSSSCGEWAVSYHGTSYKNGLCIADEGYRLSKGKRFKFGEGIYSTPDIDVALQFADTFKHNDGKRYKFVIQNRVNPKNLTKIGKADNGVGEYWILPSQTDIRPYGFCLKEC